MVNFILYLFCFYFCLCGDVGMKESFKIAICDDLQVDRDLLKAYVKDFFDNQKHSYTIDDFCCGEDFIDCEKIFDLVFLDIYMTGINGMETAVRLLGRNVRTKIIFCSSSADFAVDSYNVFAFHYLLKPATKEKIDMVLERFLATVTTENNIEVNVGRSTEIIPVDDIIWVEAARKKCIFHTEHGDVEVTAKFSEIYDKLSEYDFIKPIRYAIVPLKRISNIRNDIVLSNGQTIPVSRDMREEVKSVFADYHWKIMMQRNGEY